MAAEDTGDDASIALLHRLRAGATVHFVHHADVCSAAPEDLVTDLEPAPGTSVWYFYCVKKYKSTHGRPGGHRQRAIAASDTCWHSEAGAKEVKGSEGGGTVCHLSYGRKDGRSFSRLGWCMMEYDDATGGSDYVLCKIYRSPRAQVKPSSAASKTSKRKAGGEHPEARPVKLFHEQDTFFFTDDYAVPSTVAQVNVGGEEEQHCRSMLPAEEHCVDLDFLDHDVLPLTDDEMAILESLLPAEEQQFLQHNTQPPLPAEEQQFLQHNTQSLLPAEEQQFLQHNTQPPLPAEDQQFLQHTTQSLLPAEEQQFLQHNTQPPLPAEEQQFLQHNTQPPLPVEEQQFLQHNTQSLLAAEEQQFQFEDSTQFTIGKLLGDDVNVYEFMISRCCGTPTAMAPPDAGFFHGLAF
uniref:NAC domain-containing protein n=1 Tax=Setaria italica TaxID=4555 RepID=K4AIV8_SETIT